MAEILTESFCERCGSRYTFETTTGRRRGLGRIRTLSRGMKNFVANDDTSFSDAMALAREDDERKASLQQLDAFHRTFNFCMTCRQYTCGNCWNSAVGECLSCAPDLSHEVLPAAFPDLAPVGPELVGVGSPEAPPPNVAASAWPSADVRVVAVIPAATVAFAGVGGADAAVASGTAGTHALEAETAPPATAAPMARAAFLLEAGPAPAAETDVAPAAEADAALAPEAARALTAGLAVASPPESAPVAEADFRLELEPAPVAETDVAPVPAEEPPAGLARGLTAAADFVPATEPVPVPGPARRPAYEPAAETDVELTPTELAAVEGALHRHISRLDVPVTISVPADQPATSLEHAPEGPETIAETSQAETEPSLLAYELTDQAEPASEARAETRRFFQRFRLRRPRPTLSARAIPETMRDDTAPTTQVVSAEPTVVVEVAAAEPIEVGLAAAAAAETPREPVAAAEPALVEEAAPEPEPVAVDSEPRLEPEPVDVGLAASEPEQIEVEVAAAEPEPVAVAAEPFAASAAQAVPEPEPVAIEVAAAEPETAPTPIEVGLAAPPAAETPPEPEPVRVEMAAAAEPIEVATEEAAAAAPEAEPAPEAAPAPVAAPAPEAAPAPVDVVKQPTWRMVAPDGSAAGEAEPAPPIWPTPTSVTRRPADAMPTAAWASRVATARPVESPVWAASSRDILAAGPASAAPVGIHSCVSCGLSLSANARFCRRCGTRQG